jgi:hypothetical protein
VIVLILSSQNSFFKLESSRIFLYLAVVVCTMVRYYQ